MATSRVDKAAALARDVAVIDDRLVVGGNVPGLLKSEKVRRLRPLATQIAVEGLQLRLDSEEILEIVEQELSKLAGVKR